MLTETQVEDSKALVDTMDVEALSEIIDTLSELGVTVESPDIVGIFLSEDPTATMTAQAREVLKSAIDTHPEEVAQATFLVLLREAPDLALAVLFS